MSNLPPAASERTNRMALSWVSLGVGLGVTPFLAFIAVAFAGAGHGGYFPAKLFFPFTMLSTHWFDKISGFFLVLALVQFPLYGAILAIAAWRGRYAVTAICLLFLHAGAVTLCFVTPMPSFPDFPRRTNHIPEGAKERPVDKVWPDGGK